MLSSVPLRLSAVYCLQNNIDKAIVEFTKAVEADPKSSRNYAARALRLVEEGGRRASNRGPFRGQRGADEYMDVDTVQGRSVRL